jgi:hypothetical protein
MFRLGFEAMIPFSSGQKPRLSYERIPGKRWGALAHLKAVLKCRQGTTLSLNRGVLRHVFSQKLTDVQEVLTDSIIRAIKTVSTSETSVSLHKTTRYNIAEDGHLHSRRRENLRSHSVTDVRSSHSGKEVYVVLLGLDAA